MVTVELIEIKPVISSGKTLIQAFSGSGLVGIIASRFLISSLGMEECGYIESSSAPPVAVIEEGVAKPPMRIFQNEQYVLLSNQTNIPQKELPDLMKELFELYKSMDINKVIVLGGLPLGRKKGGKIRYTIATSNESLKLEVEMKGIAVTDQGFVYGSIAKSLLEGQKQDIPTVAILSNCIAQLADFAAVKNVVDLFAVMEGLSFNTDILQLRADEMNDDLVDEYENLFDDDDVDFDEDDDFLDPSKFI